MSTDTSTSEHHEHHDRDSLAAFGFWVYIMSDCLIFASLFAAFAVLRGNTFGGPALSSLFSLPFVLQETLILLTSSFTCGLLMLAARRGMTGEVLAWLAATFLFGASFVALELSEFSRLVADGHSWQASGALSSFFTLVGTHGLHVTFGLVWMLALGVQVAMRGLTPHALRRLTLFSLFWHFLDIIWIFIFTIVYLMGAM